MSHREPEPLILPDALTTDNPLWRYALARWQNPAVSEACLALQSRGWDVTRILCAGWLAQNGQRFTGEESAKVTEWRSRVTGVIRSARKSIPRHAQALGHLRDTLARAELEAEKTELALAWHTLNSSRTEKDTMPDQAQLIRQNLQAAAPTPDMTPDRSLRTTLEQLANHLATDREPDQC
ncbi:TIGR02444 family protein [Marinobacter persicus]|uniref:TIGR02444 family protein n=1 Tax=Marinobacter persicus TaxID=930118 RepID=A0A1I3T045_9GAMM|nr:TIGR02444 family protein [Marinobacter persicus]GHD40653.1 hypothetical protein GCM10008110_01780 [Marinobacter persicus]SFJ64050.1 TIGR02444 family protein [Marinobacter persicus]